ncbi:aspartyl protease family protein [Candidatus Zixiibacteriota bacterium]
MRSLNCIVFVAFMLILAAAVSGAAQEITDPYEILNRYFRMAGGLERLAAEQASYAEGNLSLGGMEGTVKLWTQRPGRNRVEIVLGPLNIIQGDNGEHQWVLDQNGKLQVITNPDEATVQRRQVRRSLAEYAYAQRESGLFTVSLAGREQIEGKDCYVIKITNNINVDSFTMYVNSVSFRLEKAAFVEDVESRDVFYGDYREIQGLQVAFWTKEISHRSGQTQEITLTQYVSNPEIDLALFEPPAAGAKDYQFTAGDCAEDIPFEFIGNHLFIPVVVNGEERLWVLDSGAGMTVLNKKFAEELGLKFEGELKGQGAGGTVAVNLTALPPYQIAGIEFNEQTVAVIDMDELISRIGVDVVGILGYDFLSRFVTKVDYANELVSFYDPESFVYSGDGHLLDMHIENMLFEVSATLDGTHTGSWIFDLGAGTTHLDGSYALREGYAARDGIIRMGHGAGNEYQLKDVRCDSMEFAGFTVYKPTISFSFGGTDTTFRSDNIGTLGNSLFQNFVLHIDYANERLLIEKGGEFNRFRPEDNSGLQIAWNQDHQVEVTYVSPDTPAEKAGFRKGDVLRSINGIDVDSFKGLIAIRKLLQADPGMKYELVIHRAGEEKKLKLKLAQLL